MVWEHNTHGGDARYTDMATQGEVNVGQLVRERHAREGVVIAGFATHRGTVIAADATIARPGSTVTAPSNPPARHPAVTAAAHSVIVGADSPRT